MQVSAIVPAHNEAARIGAVLPALVAAPSITEVIVVDDGSTDGTAQAATAPGVRVLRLECNHGKAGALDVGIRAAENDVLFLCDADLVGLQPRHVENMVQSFAFLQPHTVMAIGLAGPWNSHLWRVVPGLVGLLTGERVLPRWLWEEVRRRYDLTRAGYSIEMLLNKVALKHGKVAQVWIADALHTTQMQKRGRGEGFRRYLGIMAQAAQGLFR